MLVVCNNNNNSFGVGNYYHQLFFPGTFRRRGCLIGMCLCNLHELNIFFLSSKHINNVYSSDKNRFYCNKSWKCVFIALGFISLKKSKFTENNCDIRIFIIYNLYEMFYSIEVEISIGRFFHGNLIIKTSYIFYNLYRIRFNDYVNFI